jgi:hypothetical protein
MKTVEIAALFSIEAIDLKAFSLIINSNFINIIEQSQKSQEEEGRFFKGIYPASKVF